MVIGSFGLPVDWRKDEETFNQGLAKVAQSTKAAADLGGPRAPPG